MNRTLTTIAILGSSMAFAQTPQSNLVDSLAVPAKIEAVTVNANIPQVTTEQGKSLLRIAGTELRNLPEVTDILRRAPGLKADDSEISVFGKGTPQIFIDGREATYAELKLLQPQQILTIEVDRNPSARYDASFQSVVRVRTNRAKQQTSGQIVNHAYQGRRFINATAAQLQIANNRWVNYFSYSFIHQNTHNYINSTEAIHLPSSPISDSVSSDALNAQNWHTMLYGSTFDITPKHQLSWQYNGLFNNSNHHEKINERISEKGTLSERNSYKDLHGEHWSHSANMRYRFAIDSLHSFEISADYSNVTPRTEETISGLSNELNIRNRSKSNVYSAKAEYSTPLFGANLLTGLRYGHIDSRTTSEYNDKTTVTDLLNENFAAYATLDKKYGKWGWSAGLRGEFLNDNIQVGGKTLREGWEKNLFPSMSLYTSKLSKTIDLSLSYTSRITRPSVRQLNPAAEYVNSVVTSYGNPLLRSTISHNLEFGVTLWSNLSLTFGANYDINPSIEAGELDENGDAIAFKPLNIARSRKYTVGASYSNKWGPVSVTLDGGVEFPHARIPYLGEEISVGKPSWYVSTNVDVKLAKNTSLTAGLRYNGHSYYLMTVEEPYNNLTAGITQYLFKRRLQLSLSGYDLLRGSAPSWHDQFGFYETSQHASFDTRRVRISVRWMFNDHKSRYRTQSNSEEFNRIN